MTESERLAEVESKLALIVNWLKIHGYDLEEIDRVARIKKSREVEK